MILYLAFFVNYSLILSQKNNLPDEIYFASEVLSPFYQNNSMGFDRDMLQYTWKQPRIYQTLYGAEDNYTMFSEWELVYLLQSRWVKDGGNGHYRRGDAISVSYTKDNVDYFVTMDDLDENVYYSVGDLKVYDLRD